MLNHYVLPPVSSSPSEPLYGAQTQKAVENFPVSGLRLPHTFLRALGLIKQAAAEVNVELGLLPTDIGAAIISAAAAVAAGQYDAHFPIDVFQTGSATSTNMNANEVIARLATQNLGLAVHPNDHVNLGQSSNDVIPTAIHVSATLLLRESLVPALRYLARTLDELAAHYRGAVKTGRTHLMDAVPITLGQEFSAWATQIHLGLQRMDCVQARISKLAIGGTAVGTGLNAHPELGERVCLHLSHYTQCHFSPKENYFEALSAQDAAVELSGQLKVLAVGLTKICNDLRWMNSGPRAGLGEIELPALQAGSSIMPGKVNPVIPEAVLMACVQVIANDTAITLAGQAGNFQLNTMLPLIAYSLLQSLQLLANSARLLADKALLGMKVKVAALGQQVAHNPILATALNPLLGYEQGAAIVRHAYQTGCSIKAAALALTDLSPEQLDTLLDPLALAEGGIIAGAAGLGG